MPVKVEVRCCCNPQKLYGWVAVPDELFSRSMLQRVALRSREVDGRGIPTVATFEMARITMREYDSPHDRTATAAQQEQHSTYWAMKKPHEMTIEQLRKVDGFMENPIGALTREKT